MVNCEWRTWTSSDTNSVSYPINYNSSSVFFVEPEYNSYFDFVPLPNYNYGNYYSNVNYSWMEYERLKREMINNFSVLKIKEDKNNKDNIIHNRFEIIDFS
jgi:hypothetical protein